MAYRKRQNKRKNVRRMYKRRSSNAKVSLAPSITKRQIVTYVHRFDDRWSNVVTNGTTNQTHFRLNHIFDPVQTTGAGRDASQPNGFDLMSSMYSIYRVKKCKLTLELYCQAKYNASPGNTSITGAYSCCPWVAENYSTSTNLYPSYPGEQPGGSSGYYSENVPLRIKKSFNINKMVGLRPQSEALDDNVGALGNASGGPLNPIWFTILNSAVGASAGGEVHLCHYRVYLEYHTEWSCPKFSIRNDIT